MPASAHVLTTIGGSFGTLQDAEVWQVGVKLTGKASDGSVFAGYLNDLTAYVNGAAAPLQTWWTAAANLMRSDFSLDWIKAANIKPGTSQNPYGTYNGTTDAAGGPNPAVHSFGTGSNFGGASVVGTSTAPQIITVASTFRNKAAPRGPRHSASHGRIYLPFRVGSAADRIGDTTAYATATKNLLNCLSMSAATMHGLDIIGNQTVALHPALVGVNGAINLIDRIEVGNVVDTVRNRKSALRETYYGVDYA